MHVHAPFAPQERQKVTDEWNAWVEAKKAYAAKVAAYVREAYGLDEGREEPEYVMESVTVEQVLDVREEPYNPNA